MNIPPLAAFGYKPAVPLIGQIVHFTSTSSDIDGTIARQDWDLDGNGAFGDAAGATPVWAYPRPGSYTVGLRVTDNAGATTSTTRTVIVDQPPSASFNAPSVAVVGDTVTVASTSKDVDGTIRSLTWDLNGDGRFGDATTPVATHRYTAPGVVQVSLRVTDDLGATSTATQMLTVVADMPPLAAFAFTPASPVAGQPVTFTSSSTDPDGSVAAQAWDLNGDGSFTDAAGGVATRAFPAGQYMVALRVTDDRGVSTTAFQTVSVRGAPPPPDAAAPAQPAASAPSVNPLGSPPSPGLLLLSPFPVVHIRGRIFGSAVHIDVLSVRAPGGAMVRVRCRGRGCPRRTVAVRARSTGRAVRLRRLEHRYAPGAVLEVFVTERGLIGKYVRFTIRRGRAPSRVDLCVAPGAKRPSRCPGA